VLDSSTPLALIPGQNARLSFTAQAGTGDGMAITGLSFAPAGGFLNVLLRKADGTFVTSCFFNGAGSCDLGPENFPTTGTYFLDFDPSGLNAASFNAVVSADVIGTVTLDADPLPVTIARPGENARYTFSGTAGQLVSVVLTDNALDDGNTGTNNLTSIKVLSGASQVGSVSIPTSSTGGVGDVTLPQTGSYVILISPDGLDQGSIKLQVKSTVTGALAMDGSTPLALTPGQNARLSFTAQAGTGYGVAITGLSFTPAGGFLNVLLRKADGTFVTSCFFSGAGSCDLGPENFRTTGTYFLDFDPSGLNAASFNAVVSADVTGTVTLDADPVPVMIARPGQNARYSFSGTAGQLVSVVLTDNALDDGNTGTNNFTFITVFSGASVLTTVFIPTSATGVVADVTLPQTGSYVIQIGPDGLDQGNIKLQVKSMVTGALTMDGSTPLALTPGQNARLSFTAQAGTGYGVAISGLSFAPAGGFLNVFLRKADGTFIVSCGFSAAGSCDLGPESFPTTGTYFLDFDPINLIAASFNVVMSADVIGTLAFGGATSVTIARPGQNARFRFDGTAAQSISVTVSNNALDDGNPGNNTTTISVLGPTGATISNGSFSTTTSTITLTANLPSTGAYTIFIAPSDLDSGTFTLAVH